MAQHVHLVRDDGSQAAALAERLVHSGIAVDVLDDSHSAESQSGFDASPILICVSSASKARVLTTTYRSLSRAPIFVFLEDADHKQRISIVRAGADNVLSVSVDRRELAARLGAAARASPRSQSDTADIPAASALQVDEGRHLARLNGHRLSLTPTEFRLLAALVKRRGHTVPHDQLVRDVWGSQEGDEDHRALRTYVGYLRRKLHALEPSTGVVNQRGIGYRLVGADAS